MQVSQQVTDREFIKSVNLICTRTRLDVLEASIAHELFLYECAREQIKRVDPKARSYGVVAQLVCTDPRAW